MYRRLWIPVFLLLALTAAFSLAAAQTSSEDTDMLEANKELVRQFVDVLNSHDVDGLDDVLSVDFQEHNPFAPEYPPGIEVFRQIDTNITAAFPDVKVNIDIILAEGDMVASRHSVEGTNKGDFNGIPASNLPVKWTENHLFRIADGMIVEHWVEVDLVGILTQIGAMPAAQ